MPNTNFQTIFQMPGIVNNFVKQATGRDSVSQIDMDFVTVAQDKQTVHHEIDFDDAATFVNNNELPMSVIAKIAAVQEGTGDPSSENIRPITGWTGLKLWDDPEYDAPVVFNQRITNGNFNGTTGWSVNNATISATNNIGSMLASASGGFVASTTAYVANHVYLSMCEIKVTHGKARFIAAPPSTAQKDTTKVNEWEEMYIIFTRSSSATEGFPRIYDYRADRDAILIKNVMVFDLTQMFGDTIANYIASLETATTGAGYAFFRKIFYKEYYAYTANPGISCASAVNGDPYRLSTVTFPNPPGTVYGGALNLTTGLLTVTHGYIASYVDESLPGEWISDRDVYAAGTTPSEGAEVVYVLAEPVTYELDPVEVKSMIGQNNVFADTGDVAVSYTSYIPVP